MGRWYNNRGFTLLETLMVISLLGIILGIAVPKIDHTTFYLKSQGKLLCTEIRNIRFLRMTEGGGYRILLGKDYYKVIDGIKELKKVELPPQYQLLYGSKNIMFTFDGVPSYGGTTITIRNTENGKYMEITIVPGSGRVLLKDEIHKP